jgi:hypothetical protein
MREIKRNIARHMMEVAGVKQKNKRNKENPMKTDKWGVPMKTSYFALHWREYLNPNSSYRKALERQQLSMAARLYRRVYKPVRAAWPCCKVIGR